ncbi:hypothetical protein C5C27_04360 [Rathayibacter sp. AY2B7]|nr:hypothetical protein C5C27_04360 [Rathayibacter sp. AY2B7]
MGYGDTDAFDSEPKRTDVGDAATTPTADSEGTREWEAEAVIKATQSAWVEVKPGPEATARCQILIDGERAITFVQGEPGEMVRCEVETPDFAD